MRVPLALAVVFALAAPAAAADRIVLLPATGANVADPELAAATDLLRAGLEKTGRFTVELADTDGGNVAEPKPDEAAEQARDAGAALAVTLRISRLGAASTARLAAYRPDGTLAHSDSFSAASPEDLEPVLQRLAEGLATSRPAADLATIDTVTEREAREPRRIRASNSFGLRLGAIWFLDRPGTDDESSLTGGGVFWFYDARSFLAEASLDLYAGDGDALFDVGLGLYYPFSRQNVTPYAGLGLGYAWVNVEDETDGGLELRGTGGLLVGRLSTVQVRLEAGWRTSVFRNANGGERRVVQGPFATAGIGF